MSSIKDRIKSKVALDVESEEAVLAGETVQVRKMKTGARNRILEHGYRVEGKRSIPIYSKLYPLLLRETVFDPETGQKVFEPGDEALINQLDADEVDAIAKIAFRLSGLDKETRIELGKDSEMEENGESSSELPETSEDILSVS